MRSAVHVRQGGPMQLLVLALLLMGGSMGALVPPAAAQAATPTPEVCFQTDADGNPETEGLAFRCMADLPNGPNFLQGDFVDIQVQGSPVGAYIRIRCLTSCHETAGKDYYAQYAAGTTVRFPRDFKDPLGDNAVADRAPRYNSSWEVVVLVGGAPVARGLFNVWLFDRFTSPGLAVMPGERHAIRASGFDPGANVQLTLERRDREGKWVDVPTPSGSLVLFTASGFNNHVYFPNAWVVPKDEAARIAECGADRDGCYRFVVKGAGKADETVPFRVAPATLVASTLNSAGNVIHPDGAEPRAVARTTEIHVAVGLHYPGGRTFQGEAFTPTDAKISPITNAATLRGRVERVNVTATLPIQDITFRFAPASARWEATWTVPKDFPLRTAEPDSEYRIRLLPDRDVEKHGNLVPEVILAEHVIDRATVRPALVSGLTALPRTEEANVSFDVRYLNGTPVAASDIAAPLQGCFYIVSQGDPLNCARAGVNRTDGAYEDGKWVFRVRYGRAYPNLEDHRFHLQGGTEDRWGNTIQESDVGPFKVTVASPRVAFSTILRGRDLTTLERGGGPGNHVSVQATITYADGAAFNHAVTPNASTILPGILTKSTPEGVLISQTRFDLREVDPDAGRWAGDLLLNANDADTPLGRWTFRFEIYDNLTAPNVNVTGFERTIVGIPILIDPVRQPFGLVETETLQTFRFRVLYQDGNEVPRGDLLEGLQAYVYRYNPANQTAYGPPVSTRLVPQYSLEGGWYQGDFRVPGNLFSGTYVFVVSGRDRHGNALAQDAYSREFSTTSRTLDRSVITQPGREVMRGESATVVFDAREGDVGIGGTGAPFLRVERFDASQRVWIVERADVRQTAADLLDHVGLFPITLTTPTGLYRFTFEGRDASLQRIVSTSENFTVLPTDVPRVIFTPPPERIVKGSLFTFGFERQEGDRLSEVQILLDGRDRILVDGQPFALPLPVLVPLGTFFNVTWQIPFEAPSGNYTLRFRGLDLYGNHFEVFTPAIQAEPAQLAGRILGSPSRTVARNEPVTLLFGITYPDNPTGYVPATRLPLVQVVNESGYVATADVRPEDRTYVATWTPPADVPAGEYRFEVSGTGGGGNAFPSLRSAPFRVVPGAVTRVPAQDVGSSVERMATLVFSVPVDAQDRDVEFLLAYYGAINDASGALFDTRPPLTSTILAHVLEPATGRYVARFITDQQTSIGMYRIVMRATDRYDNEVSSRSTPFLLSPTSVAISPDAAPADNAFLEGVPITLSYVARYRSGSIMDDTNGRLSAVVLYTAPGRAAQPVTDRPVVEYRDGRWYATWTPPAQMPEGVYEFSIGGADNAGNVIVSSKSRPYVVTTTIGGSAAKLLPAPGVEYAVLALAAVALALSRRTR